MTKKPDLENERKYLLSLISKGGGEADWAKSQANIYAQQNPGFDLNKQYSPQTTTTNPNDVRLRDYINSYGGRQYGITDKDIGWDGSRILLGGQAITTPTRVDESGRSWGDVNQIKQAIDNYATQNNVSPVQYESPYSGKIDAMLEKLNSQPQFNPASVYDSPEYRALEERTNQFADKSRQNTMADAASLTGGLPSSYAIAAAANAEGEIKGKLLDQIPALTQMGYQRHLGEQDRNMSTINLLQSLDNTAYQRHATDRDYMRGIYESDRNYGRGVLESDRGFNQQVSDSARNFDYQVTRDQVMDDRWMNQWNYQQKQDKLANALQSRQISISERNAILARDKFEWEKDVTNPANMKNPETIGALYSSMFNSGNPEEWLKQNAQYLSKDELKTLSGFLPKTSEVVDMLNALSSSGLIGQKK